MLAARWAGYRYLHDWQDLTGDQKALLIAAYRTAARLEALEAHAAQERARNGR